MSQQLSSEIVWKALEKELFAVLGVATEKGESRTSGIVYIVHEKKIYIAARKSAWKVRHIRTHAGVSLTVPIHKQIPFMPWVRIPAATITFCGEAVILQPQDLSEDILYALLRTTAQDEKVLAEMAVIEVRPVGEFVTYGIGIPMIAMRDPKKARGRAPV